MWRIATPSRPNLDVPVSNAPRTVIVYRYARPAGYEGRRIRAADAALAVFGYDCAAWWRKAPEAGECGNDTDTECACPMDSSSLSLSAQQDPSARNQRIGNHEFPPLPGWARQASPIKTRC